MTLETWLIDISLAAAAAHGLLPSGRPISGVRTIIKTSAVAALAVLAYVDGGPPSLVGALALSAAGDAFLAGDPKRWAPLGLGAFLGAHMAYIHLFNRLGGGLAAFEVEPWRALALIAAFAAEAMMLIWLWPAIGPSRLGMAIYAGVLAVLVATAYTLPRGLWPAMPGAVLFLASDALLSGELFMGLRAPWVGRLSWAGYYAAQVLIAYGYLR